MRTRVPNGLERTARGERTTARERGDGTVALKRSRRDPAAPSDPLGREASAAAAAAKAGGGGSVASALRDDAPRHKAVLLELYYRERSVAEAAKALGIALGTVKSRAYYAIRALRLVCEERGLIR